MKNFIDRRLWLKQSSLALAGLGLTHGNIIIRTAYNEFGNMSKALEGKRLK